MAETAGFESRPGSEPTISVIKCLFHVGAWWGVGIYRPRRASAKDSPYCTVRNSITNVLKDTTAHLPLLEIAIFCDILYLLVRGWLSYICQPCMVAAAAARSLGAAVAHVAAVRTVILLYIGSISETLPATGCPSYSKISLVSCFRTLKN